MASVSAAWSEMRAFRQERWSRRMSHSSRTLPTLHVLGERDTRRVIANLLPGLRELRAPLAAGYLWLLGAWLLVEPHIADRTDATGAVAALYDLESAAGPLGVVAGVSFVAYLIGSLSEELLAKPWRQAMLWWPRTESDAPDAWKTPSLSNNGLRSIEFVVSAARLRIHDAGLTPEDVRWQRAMPTTVTEGEPVGDMVYWLGRRTIEEFDMSGIVL
jgi:hypothetical protein